MIVARVKDTLMLRNFISYDIVIESGQHVISDYKILTHIK